LTITVNDGIATPVTNGLTSVVATSIKVGRASWREGGNQPVGDNATVAPFQGVSVADIDTPAQTLTVTVTLSSAANGVFTPASLTASGFTSQGGGVYRFTGTAAQTTTAIRKLVFDPTDNQVAPGGTVTTTLTITVNDGLRIPVPNGLTSVVATSINDAPTIVGMVGNQPVGDNATVAPFQGVSVAHIDTPAQTLTVTVTLSSAANGVFTSASLTASG